jgi:hypothetical protein
LILDGLVYGLFEPGLLQHDPQRVDDAGNVEKETQHQVDQGRFDVVGFQENGQRRKDDGQDDE